MPHLQCGDRANPWGTKEGTGGCPDRHCNSTPCLSAGFPSTALCFAAPALSGVYGFALSPRPICHVHHAGLVGSSCGISPVRWRVSALVCPMLFLITVCCDCVQSSPFCPGPCSPPVCRDLPRQEGYTGERTGRPRDITPLFFLQEGDGAKPKTLSSQKLSPKWCFLDCEYLLPLGALCMNQGGDGRGL